MNDIILQLYYMIDDLAGQLYEKTEETEALLSRQSALKQEIARRLGEDGWKLLDDLFDLNLSLEDIHDKALFRTAFSFGMEMAIS